MRLCTPGYVRAKTLTFGLSAWLNRGYRPWMRASAVAIWVMKRRKRSKREYGEYMAIGLRWIRRKASNRKAAEVVGSRREERPPVAALPPLWSVVDATTTKMRSSELMVRPTCPTGPRHPSSHVTNDRIENSEVHRVLQSTTVLKVGNIYKIVK